MNKSIPIATILLFGLLQAATSSATFYEFYPDPVDLYGLDHYKAYEWGIDFDLPADEIITGAYLEFDQIYNWNWDSNDLYVTLLDIATPGVTVYQDNQVTPNYFSSGLELVHYEDLSAIPQNLAYTFTDVQVTALTNALADGNFGIGIDPDCHFYNDYVELHIDTVPVPEPATMLLFGVGLAGIAGIQMKRNIRS